MRHVRHVSLVVRLARCRMYFTTIALRSLEFAAVWRSTQRTVNARKFSKVPRELIVLLERSSQHGIACRHIGVVAGRDLREIAQALLQQPGQWLAVVDIGRAAVGEVALECGVAAHRVIPRQPVEHDAREQATGHEPAAWRVNGWLEEVP